MSKKLTKEEFVKKAKEKHKDKYDYSIFIYLNSHIKGKIKCNKCNLIFEQTPSDHLRGRGCPKCGVINGHNKQRKTKEQFIIDAKNMHKNKYNYEKFIYTNNSTNGIITCLSCKNDFMQSPNRHLCGCGCPKCGVINSHNKQTKTQDGFIKDAMTQHCNKYNYEAFIYINDRTKGIITCLGCKNDFTQTPNSHLKGRGCPKCNRHGGVKEDICRKVFQHLFCVDFPTARSHFLKGSKGWPLELDGFSQELKLAFEHQGMHHYDKNHKFYSDRVIENDQLKVKLCKENGITLIIIPELHTLTHLKDLKSLIKQQCQEQNFKLPKSFYFKSIYKYE